MEKAQRIGLPMRWAADRPILGSPRPGTTAAEAVSEALTSRDNSPHAPPTTNNLGLFLKKYLIIFRKDL